MALLWNPLQQLHVLPVLRAPELDAGLHVGSHQSGVERQNHLPQLVGDTSLDASQDMVGLLGCRRTLVACVQLFIHQFQLRQISPAMHLVWRKCEDILTLWQRANKH